MDEARFRAAEDRLWASVGVRPTERVLELSRTGVTVRMQEVGEGPPVVFVHGGSNCGASWASLVARLDGFRCVLVDRPGCGLSPPLATGFDDVARLGAFADAFVVVVLDALDLERAHLVATSFGGYTALRSAAAHPDRIERLVELGYPIGAPVERIPMVMRVTAIPLLGRLAASVPPTPRAVRMIFRGIGLRQALEAGRVTQEMLDWFLSMLRDTDTMRNELRAGPRVILPLRGLNDELLLSPALLARIEAPTFFLWGEEDPFGGADTARAFVRHVPNAELELMPGAGHAVWMDDAEHVAKALGAFLTRSG
jgi:pimeloyl-ACP methyl ester carboxylesterase